uniref:Putative secreted protein n=1 Tax=Anopheles marajoara TaxID=58244 RepID=A0A2M4CED0_9DIPT
MMLRYPPSLLAAPLLLLLGKKSPISLQVFTVQCTAYAKDPGLDGGCPPRRLQFAALGFDRGIVNVARRDTRHK